MREASGPFDENSWEIYNLNEDYAERIDLAKNYPEKLAELGPVHTNSDIVTINGDYC
jgi:hypothetical protein